MPRHLLLLATLLLFTMGRAHAYQVDNTYPTEEGSGITIQLKAPFAERPGFGFFPLHVIIENLTTQDLSWDLRFLEPGTSPGYTYQTSIAVPAGQTRDSALLIPSGHLEDASGSYSSTNCIITGPGVRGGAGFVAVERSSSRGNSGFVAIAEPLGSMTWSKLQSALSGPTPPRSYGTTVSVPAGTTWKDETEGRALGRARFDSRRSSRSLNGSIVRLVDEVPADARALSGVAGLWLREEEWRALTGAHRLAVRQWAQEGGNLTIASTRSSTGQAIEPPLVGLPPVLSGKSAPFGLGQVRVVTLNSGELNVNETAQSVVDLDSSPSPPWAQDFGDNWTLRETVGQPSLNVPLVIIFVCVFGLLIGPVNFLVFAPPARRYRLFFTVPLISLGASVLLLIIIAVGDGMGAVGGRSALLFVPAGENRITLAQEQMVRTKLLFARGFQLPETVAAAYIQGPGDPRNSYGRRGGNNLSLQRQGTAMSGDWFRSRTSQGLFLRTTVPSRGEVTLRPSASPDGPPELLSTLASTLREVFYVDAAGKYWKTTALSTGRPAKLTSTDVDEFNIWAEPQAAKLSLTLRAQWQQSLRRPGYFYAEAEPAAENTIPTLSSISWVHEGVLCLGPCTPETAP